jgi:NAD(P)-dependent dehydrogenase (short-subunit alcohol dehydrogenase family)
MTSIAQKLRLDGRRVVITGAGGFIGRVIANTVAELGANVVLIDRPSADCSTLADELTNRFGVEVKNIAVDLEQQIPRTALCKQLISLDGGLHVLINNAAFVGDSALQGWATTFQQQSTETWRRALEVNLTAVFDLCRELGPTLAQSGDGCILNVASIYGHMGPDYSLYEDTDMQNPAAYSASKGGLIQLTRWLATTLAPSVRVNAISPGGVWRNQPSVFVERYAAKTPLGRMATEDDFAGAVAYLCSDLAAYVTGENLKVDGGWSIW